MPYIFGEVRGIPTYIAVCCREWELAFGYPVGRCGICGQRPRPKEEE